MQHQKSAFATSNACEKFLLSIHQWWEKNTPQHLFHIAWNIINHIKHLQHVYKTRVILQHLDLFLQHPHAIFFKNIYNMWNICLQHATNFSKIEKDGESGSSCHRGSSPSRRSHRREVAPTGELVRPHVPPPRRFAVGLRRRQGELELWRGPRRWKSKLELRCEPRY